MFKTGDRVRVVNFPSSDSRKIVGTTGVITSPSSDYTDGFNDVEFDSYVGKSYDGLFYDSELELVSNG